jgi:hypothetical protein
MIRQQTLHVALFLRARARARAFPVCYFIFPTADVTDIAQRYEICFFTIAIMDGGQGYYIKAQVLQ